MGFRKEIFVLLIASVFASLTAVFGRCLITHLTRESHWMKTSLYGLVCMVCLLGCVICLDIWRLKPANSHTLWSLLSQWYKYILLLRLKSPYLRWYIEQTTKDPKKMNEQSLLHILRQNQNSSYGQEHNFTEMKSREDFIKMHPITTPEHYQTYMQRIMADERNVLYPCDTFSLISTSGTTGAAKIYAFTKEHVQFCHFQIRQLFGSTIANLLNLQRMAQFHIFSPVKTTKGGIPIGAASQIIFSFPPHNLIPKAYSKLHSEDASYYAQALFSLAERELGYIYGFSADLMYSYWKFITANWGHLCDDISRGQIGNHISMPEDVMAELSKQLPADPARAEELRKAIQGGICGLAKRVWPMMSFIIMGKSAAFKMCTDILMENHLKGVKVIGFLHGATEGFTGLNYEVDAPWEGEVLTLTPFPAFMEFIPIGDVEKENPVTVFPEQMKLNKLYEVVHTTFNGLYRCRYGDIIKVVGFKNKTPKYEFVFKLGQRLNIAYERTPDKFLYEAIKQCQHYLPSGVTLVNYTTTESVTLEKLKGPMGKGHYIFFMEFDTDRNVKFHKMEKEMDQALLVLFQPYKRFRDCDSIGTLKIIQVKCGTFEGLKLFIWNDSPHGQFKMPRVLRREPALQYLLDQGVSQQ